MPLISGMIGAITNRQSAIDTNEMNYKIAKETNAFNSAEAEKQRNWQAEMDNTKYQRQMADLEAAGINPALAYGNGLTGANIPSGATASGSAAHMTAPLLDLANVTNGLGQAAASAYALHKLKQVGGLSSLAEVGKFASSAMKTGSLIKALAALF